MFLFFVFLWELACKRWVLGRKIIACMFAPKESGFGLMSGLVEKLRAIKKGPMRPLFIAAYY